MIGKVKVVIRWKLQKIARGLMREQTGVHLEGKPDMSGPRQRLYASLVILGACILLFRTVLMMAQGAMAVLVAWVLGLLLAELVLDVATLAGSVRWWVTREEGHARLPLRTCAAAVILHAVRVLIFVLGRIGPWIDFDVRPEQRALHSTRWSWGWLYFAAVMSVLGVLGVLIIWRYRRRARKND